MLARWRRPSGPSVVLAEVHDPRHWPATGDERPSARLRFYARHGARLLDLAWIQPRLTPGGDRVEGMLLLVLAARPPALLDGGAALDGALVRAWVEQQLRDAEGDAALADPGFAEILAASRRPASTLLDLDVVAPDGPSLD
jgi:hypothetical protein